MSIQHIIPMFLEITAGTAIYNNTLRCHDEFYDGRLNRVHTLESCYRK